MKKQLLQAILALVLLPLTGIAQPGNFQKGDYGYLFCHMNDAGPAWTAYALSRDGFHYHDLIGGDSIFSDAVMAPVERRSRDAYICRKHDGSGYLMAVTDMEATDGSRQRLGKKETWDSYAISLLCSNDLIHWQSTSFDFRKGLSIFCNPEAESVYKDWSTINRVWAPQIMWDETYRWPDGQQGGYFVYYSMWNRNEEKYDRIYYSYADESFTKMTQPRLLIDWGYATIDTDINWVEADQQWHLMIKKEGGKPGLYTATAKQLTGPWSLPVEDDYVSFEGNKKCEGVSAFQLAGDSSWVIGYIEYSSRPKNYRLCLADKYMRNFHSPRNILGVSRPQHGSFLRITKEEYDRLQEWSDNIEAQKRLRKETELKTWQFSHNKQTWQEVTIPHDWAISGPFDKKWDLQVVAIEQNGEKQATEKSGRSGALPWIGEGYYKTTFRVPSAYKHAELVFDGAMSEPTIFINGKKAAYWAYGYNTFRVDATPYLNGDDNLLEVSLKNVEESSRWYPGAGLYRPVTLILTGESRIDRWGTYFRTLYADGDKAEVEVSTKTQGGGAVEVSLINRQGHVVAAAHNDVDPNGQTCATMEVEKPELWSPESPYLYQLRVQLMDNGRIVDETIENVGLRTISVSKEGGFQLNGVTRKLKGVCLHHDLGPLGAAVNKAALIRQVKTMKDMGCDAIRTAHNMPSQLQMQVCDSLGMMVMAESFDMWLYPKCKNGYARFFREWSDKDIENLVLANRNHPSIVMWSIGNEIPEQNDAKAVDIVNHLQDLCHQLDPSRPVTQGMDRAEQALKSGFAQAMDVPGFNYRVHKYQKNIEQLPQGFLLGSETASTVSSRGVYKFPVEVSDNSRFASWATGYDPTAIQKADGQCSSYDVEYCSWSNLPDDDWVWQDDKDWVIGEFVWTGFDYLGEPTPYDEYWPSRSSYFGICDLAGLPKDRYWLYRSHWNKQEHTIHLLPHWSWGNHKTMNYANKKYGERIREITPVYCYTDYPEAELFVNGKSQGRIHKNPAERLDRYRLRWNEVKYEPGELKVVVYDADRQTVGEKTVRTAGAPARLQLDVWTQNGQGTLTADGEDLAYVTVSLVDKDGTLIPNAADQLRFEVEGAGTFRAVCNGDATSLEPFTLPTMKLFSGQLVVIVQAGQDRGNLTLKVIDEQRNFTQTITIPIN
jgi:beta-galactosidase